MNILQQQNSAKELSDQQLQQELLNPSGALPSYLALSELQRRKDMRASYQSLQGKPDSSMAEEFARGLGGADVGKYGNAVRGMMPSSPGGEQPPMPDSMQAPMAPPTQAPMQAPMQPPMQPPMQDPMQAPQQQFADGGAVMSQRAQGATMAQDDILAGYKKPDGTFNPAALSPLAGIIGGQSVGDSLKASANAVLIGPGLRLLGVKSFADGGTITGPFSSVEAANTQEALRPTMATLAPSGVLASQRSIQDILRGIGITNQRLDNLGIAGAANSNPFGYGPAMSAPGGSGDGNGPGGGEGNGPGGGVGTSAGDASVSGSVGVGVGSPGTDGVGTGTGETYAHGGPIRFDRGGGIPSWLYRVQQAVGIPTERNVRRAPAITDWDVAQNAADAATPGQRIELENPNAVLSNPYPLSRQYGNRIPGPINPAIGNQSNPYPEGTDVPPIEPRSSAFQRNVWNPIKERWNKTPEPVFSESDMISMEQANNRPSWFTSTTEAERAEIEARNAVLEQKKKDLIPSPAPFRFKRGDSYGDPASLDGGRDSSYGEIYTPITQTPANPGTLPPAGTRTPDTSPPPNARRQTTPPGGGVPNARGPGGGASGAAGGAPDGGIGSAVNPDLAGFMGQVRGLQLPDRFGEIEARNQQERDDLKAGRESDKGLAMLQAGMTMAGGTSPYALSNIAAGTNAGIREWSSMEKEFRVANQAIRSADNAIAIARANRDEKQLELGVKVKMHFEQQKASLAATAATAAAAAAARADAREDNKEHRALVREQDEIKGLSDNYTKVQSHITGLAPKIAAAEVQVLAGEPGAKEARDAMKAELNQYMQQRNAALGMYQNALFDRAGRKNNATVVRSKEEYNALPDGTRFLDTSTGDIAIKKSKKQ